MLDMIDLHDTLYSISYKCNNCETIIVVQNESEPKCRYCNCCELSKPTEDEMQRVVNDYCGKIHH